MTRNGRMNRRGWRRVAVLVLVVLLTAVVARIVAAPTANGRIVYSDGTATPQARSYTASTTTFSAAAAMQTGVAQTWMVDRAAPTRNEHIAGYVTTTGVLYIQRWNGTAWSAEWNVTVGGNGVDGRRFDIVYENTSGDAIVVYSNNSTGASELRYRVWNGSTWTAAANLDSARLTGTPNAIKLASRTTTGSDEIAATIADSNNILTSLIWSGAAWGNEPGAAHGTLAGTAGQNDLFDHAYESASGDLLVIFTTSTPQQNHRTYSGGTWGTVTSWATGRAAPLQMVAAPNPDPASNQILCMFNRSGNADIFARIWGGGAFGTQATVGANGATTAIEQRTINAGWLKSGTSTVAIVFWGSTTTTNRIDYNYTTNGGTSWAGAANYTVITMGSRRWFDVDEDPQATDTLMLTVSDSNNDLFARQLTWNGTALTWATPTNGTITTALANVTTQNFDFSYDRYSPPAATLTVGNGTNPGDLTGVCPGETAKMMDAFTLQTSSGTDTVTAVTVTLAAGTSAGLSLVEITNDAGTTVLGSVANPATDAPSISLTPNVTANTTLTQYKVRVTPKTHANMPLPPGATYTVTGTVTAVASSLTKTYSDSASSTVTIDNAAPSNATWGTITPGNGQVVLNWTNPATDFGQVVVLRNTATIGDAPAEGASYSTPGTIGTSTIVFVGTVQTLTNSGLTNGTGYYYKIFVRDACGNYSAGAQTGPHTPTAPTPAVTPGAPVASIDSCNQITVSAPFTGDTDADSSTVISRGASASGPWTAVCSRTGASPRVCVDNALVASSSYYYQVDFTDPDGVVGTDPRVIGPFSTPSCGVPATTAGTVSATVSSCRQITVTAPFTGDFDGDGSIKVEYNTTNTWPGTVACSAASGPSPRQCLVTGLSPSTSYYVRTTFSDVDGVTGTNPQTLGPLALGACAADQVAPMALILSPMRDAVVGGVERVKVQVWDEGTLAASNPVQFAIDAGAFSATGVTVNANYNCGTGCRVYELSLDTTALANGSHSFSVQVTDAAGNVARTAWAFRVNNSGAAPGGAGTLLRRTTGSQLCVDCHSIASHSSQHTSTKYGNWSIDCLTCHTPHKTANVDLVRPSIQTPGSGTNAIQFRTSDRAGGTNPQYAHLGDYSGASNTPYTDGICETCHTKTNHYRNDASGGDHTHNSSTRCISCHKHSDGFAAGESTGGYRCSDCHPAIWQGMTGGVAKTSKHTLGAVVGTNDSFTDSNVTFGNPLSATLASERKCLSCHQDHVHNNPGTATHDYNVHRNAATQVSRSVTRDGAGNIVTGTPARTDFDAADLTNGGMCLSCHKNGVSATRPVIGRAAFDASAHDYTNFSTYGAWSFDLHDGSKFDRNCTKCHSDRGDAQPSDATAPFGSVHFSDYPMLLAGSKNPAGAPATFVCYNCHGNGTTGVNRSGKNIATTMAKTRNHTSNADSVHDSVAEFAGAAFGNTLGGKARHASCMDCHDTHKAKAGLHTAQTNLAGPSLEGAWGAQLSTNPARWVAPASANFTKKVIVAGTDVEATLCFKCHSAYYGTLPTTPSGTFQETDQAREFNPNNASSGATAGGFHPVLASAGGNLGATSNIIAPWTQTSLMTCSDCHASDTTTDPAGPHGSAAGFMLKGPNTTWSASVVTGTAGMPAGTFCANCHAAAFTNSRFPTHSSRSNHRVACWNCHAAIPHGTARPGLLVAVDQSTYGDKTTDVAPYRQMPAMAGSGLYIKSYPANNTTNWGQTHCGCGTGGGH